MAPLLTLLIVLAFIGVLLYCFNQFVVMDTRVRNVINALVLLVLFVYVLGVLLGHPLRELLR